MPWGRRSSPPPLFLSRWRKRTPWRTFFACASPLAEWDIQIPEGKDGQEEKAGAFVEALYGEGLWGRITLRFTDGEVFLHGTASFQPDAEEIAQAFETEGNE